MKTTGPDDGEPGDSPSTRPRERRPRWVPIVALGASAGGLEAFEQFFHHAVPDGGVAFVLVTHLDPGHASMLTEILQKTTTMPVVEAQDQMVVKPNQVHVIPPNRDMAIFRGALQLSVPATPRGQRMPIDSFFRSLADEQGEGAVCVILSGSGTDGTLGLRAVQGAGGVSFVQEPSSAKYDGMPTSAIRSGLATYVLPVEEMPRQIAAYVHTLRNRGTGSVLPAPAGASALSKVLLLLRSQTGHDFSLYKLSTIQRRVERRMTILGIEAADVYARYLQAHPEEVTLLFKELLINVTSFFRDAEAFAALKRDVVPLLFEGKPDDYAFRVWVPGCSTGEEAYSIAMVLREHMDETRRELKVQLFGTDVDEDAIKEARSGRYPPNIAMDVSPDRLRRFFVREESGYGITKAIRDMVIFATQDVIKAPPFTRLDLVSCRNVLIYFEAELQSRLIPVFHYALKPGGVLFLSPSEGIGSHTDLFSAINRKFRVFQAKASEASTRAITRGIPRSGDAPKGTEEPKKAKDTSVADLTRRALLDSYAPPSLLTDEAGNVLYVHGDTGRYLRMAPGQPSLNAIAMAREGLQLELRRAIHDAATKKRRVVCKDVPFKTHGAIHRLNLTIKPLKEEEAGRPLLIVTFQDAGQPAPSKAAGSKRPARARESTRVRQIEQELLHTRKTLQATIDELQASSEDLKSMNEELQSTNEELQSTNQEIETSREELQSINEELLTVNAELQAKIELLTGLQNDMKNLLDNTNIGTIFLDRHLAIRRFSREAAVMFRLVASDVGRSLADIKSNVEGEDLVEDARAVLDSLVPRDKQVQTAAHAWYLVRILPYRTLENIIEGVVLTSTEITAMKKVEEALQQARSYAESLVDSVREPLLVLDDQMRVVSAGRSFYRTFGVTADETVGRRVYELGERQWDIPKLRERLETIVRQDEGFEDFEVEHHLAGTGPRRMLLNGRRVPGQIGQAPLILLAIEDVSERAPGRSRVPEVGS